MATVEACERAFSHLGDRLSDVDHDVRRKHMVDRSVSCRITDLGVTFYGHLRDGHLCDVVQVDPGDAAQIRLAVSSDDLIALTEGSLHFAHAWASGRLKIEASVRDMLRLRNLL